MSLKSTLFVRIPDALIVVLSTLAFFSLPRPSYGQDATAKADDVIVKLLEQGAAPRQKMRMTPKAGQKQTLLMKMKMNQSIVMRGQKLPAVPTPTMQFTIDVAVTDVDPNGDISFQYTYPKVEVLDDAEEPSAAKDLMESMLKSMEGLSGSAIVTNRGITKKSDIDLPPNVSPQIAAMIGGMKDSMSRISSPLPEEPIGVGAKWSVSQEIHANGMRLKQTLVHTVKEIKGNNFDLAVDLTQSADEQEVKTPGVPPGTTMLLKSLASTGEGKMMIDSRDVFPISQIRSDSKMEMEMVAGGQTIPMQTELTLEMTFAPVNESEAPKSAEK